MEEEEERAKGSKKLGKDEGRGTMKGRRRKRWRNMKKLKKGGR